MIVDEITVKNDEYYTPKYAITPIMKYVPITSKVWCPFDTNESLYVKEFTKAGYEVVNTHIEDGFDFFTHEEECDVIISNPPYSKKNEVLERLFNLKKPFAMLIGVVGIFESKKRFELFRDNKFEIMYFDKRVSFFKSYEDQKPSLNPPFSTVYICSGVLPDKILFETINKKDL